MAVLYNPRMVTDGLVLCLDAANLKSYPGTGVTWSDMSGVNNTGTLINGVGYSQSNSGSLSFDGTNDYVDCPNNSSLSFTNNLTVSVWCALNSSSGQSNWMSPLMKASGDDWNDGFGFYQTFNTNLFNFYVNQYDGGTNRTVSVSRTAPFPMTNWVGTYDGANLKLYQNGSLVQTGSSYTDNISNSSTSLEIGKAAGFYYYWSGTIPQVSIYNRALTASEVLQNFNSLRGRFGL